MKALTTIIVLLVSVQVAFGWGFGEDKNVKVVKEGAFRGCPDKTIGDMLSAANFDNSGWKYHEEERIVEFYGAVSAKLHEKREAILRRTWDVDTIGMVALKTIPAEKREGISTMDLEGLANLLAKRLWATGSWINVLFLINDDGSWKLGKVMNDSFFPAELEKPYQVFEILCKD